MRANAKASDIDSSKSKAQSCTSCTCYPQSTCDPHKRTLFGQKQTHLQAILVLFFLNSLSGGCQTVFGTIAPTCETERGSYTNKSTFFMHDNKLANP